MHQVIGAVRIGRKTFGKGSVQDTFPLANGDMLVLTTAEYFVGNLKTAIDHIGITPEYDVPSGTIEVAINPNSDNDPQLKKAVELLRIQVNP